MSKEIQSLEAMALLGSGPSTCAWIRKRLIRAPRSTSQVSTTASRALCSLHEEMDGPGGWGVERGVKVETGFTGSRGKGTGSRTWTPKS